MADTNTHFTYLQRYLSEKTVRKKEGNQLTIICMKNGCLNRPGGSHLTFITGLHFQIKKGYYLFYAVQPFQHH